MTKTLLLVLALLAGHADPLVAQTLAGDWRFEGLADISGHYSGRLVIDQEKQARLRGVSELQEYSECGHAIVDGSNVEIIFKTAKSRFGYSVDHFYCTLREQDALVCRNVDAQGKQSYGTFHIIRVGGIPASPAERLDDVCTIQQVPTS